MLSTNSIWRSSRWLMPLAAFLVAGFPGATPAQAADTTNPHGKFGAEYAGSETCQACHEDIYNSYEKSPHRVTDSEARRGWAGHGCESCHGAGAKHAESADATAIQNPARLTASLTDNLCLGCHISYPAHAGRTNSSHLKNSVSCTTCHKVHANGPNGLVARKPADVNALCSSCHTNVMAEFRKPFRHKVPENAMSCTDCHNQHGSVKAGMQRTFGANEASCINCHTDKRGPFPFEHSPVRLESCSTCHEPHGSSNPRMLTRHEVRQVCLECHANTPGQVATPTTVAGVVPPAIHDLRSPRYQNCTVCHSQVHGSYADRTLLR